jgi:hypothetical protein
MTDSPSASSSGYCPRVFDQAIFMDFREMATPSEILCSRGTARSPGRKSFLSTHIS